MRWAQPMKQLFRSKVGMGGAITAVAATTIAGGIIAIGGDFHLGSTAWRSGDIAEELARLRYVNQRDAKFSNFRRRQCNPLCFVSAIQYASEVGSR
jgi:hypothetical protein